jgi:hypothetical protein
MRLLVPLCLAASAAAVQPLAAAPVAPAARPASVDPAAIAAANRLLDAMKFEELLDRTMTAVIADAEKTIPARLEAAAKEPIPADLKAKASALIVDFMRRAATANRAEVRKGTALIYARHFTAAEIDHMAEMMRDPVMVKMQTAMPQIMTESMALSQANIDREMPKMMEELQTLLEQYSPDKGGQQPSS